MTKLSTDALIELMEKALETNRERDQIEREVGFSPASMGTVMEQLRTVQMAIEAGLLTGDLNCIAEGAATLALITGSYTWRTWKKKEP